VYKGEEEGIGVINVVCCINKMEGSVATIK
jgi:hypothetical protein